MHWTRLQNSLLAKAAIPLYQDPRRAYHTLAHLERMFAWATHFGLPYDTDLDEAVWGHDVILDAYGKNEARSRDWLLAICPSSVTAGGLIMTTATHQASSDNRLALIDLADFLDEDQSIANTDALIAENQRIYNASLDKIFEGMSAFLTDLSYRVGADVQANAYGEHTNTFRVINHGIRKTIARIEGGYHA